MEKIEWHIKNQNAKYKFSENLSKESSINISKEIFDFLGAKQNGDIITVTLRKNDFLLAFSKLISNLPLYYYRNGSQKAEFNSEFFETSYNEIAEHFVDNERIQYQVKLRINDESTTRYYLYRMDGTKNFILRDFLIGENSTLNFIKNDSGEIIIEPVIKITNKDDSLESSPSNKDYISTPTQIIYYGVPGSGKSHKIDEKTKDLPEDQKMRVVFHPEYTNADFVGQILPVQAPDGIAYLFKAGPFSRILKRALKNPDKPYYLIIEEINRGNAAAIFGDLFQLLDRNSDGWSSYSIENMDINAFIRSSDDKYSDKNAPSSVPIGNITFTENTSIRLPPNLSLFATMNTSDQNVFTLDNAFQRRWDMKLVENKFEGEDAEKQRNAKIGGTDVSWGIFQTHINKKIGEISSSVGMSSMEDKRLGCWFVKADSNENGSAISKEKFAEKVLKYLWDDAFKFNREEIFDLKDKTQSLERIVQDFKAKESGPCDWSIFKDTSFVQSANEQ